MPAGFVLALTHAGSTTKFVDMRMPIDPWVMDVRNVIRQPIGICEIDRAMLITRCALSYAAKLDQLRKRLEL